MAGPRNTAQFFADMVPIDTGGDTYFTDCIGFYVTTGGAVAFDTSAGGVGIKRTVTFPDGTWVYGLVTRVYAAGGGTTATGLFALK